MQIYTDKYFENPAEIIEIFDPKKVKEGIDRVERLRDSGFFLLGYMRYNLNKINQKGAPLVYFEAYKNYTTQVSQKFFSSIANNTKVSSGEK